MSHVRIEVRWRDLDLLGHLNQAVYHEYLEEGRSAFLGRLGGFGLDFAVVVARVEIDYRSEVRRDHGHVDIATRLARIGRSSLTLESVISLPDGTVAAESLAVLVAWDAVERRSRAFSDAERERLEQLLDREGA